MKMVGKECMHMHALDWLLLFLGNNKEVNTLVVSNAIYSSMESKSQPSKSRKGLQNFLINTMSCMYLHRS